MAISRPLVYGALGVLTLAVYMWADPASDRLAAKPLTATATASKASDQNWEFPPEETSAHFEKPKGPMRNIFLPLIKSDRDRVAPLANPEELMRVPASLASGDPNWTYTGMAEVNGVKLAALENTSTHQFGYVKEAEQWRKARVVRITIASMTLADKDGKEDTVFRYVANATPKPKPVPDAGFRPMELGSALKGVIGPQIHITRSPLSASPRSSPPPPPPVDTAEVGG